MNRVRVYIATTEGPAEIQRLAEEDPEVRSVICLNGTCEALPISPGYDAFVRKPTGIIERLFGHPVYRMDVSQRIGEGRSWQLGALVAHALNAAGKLAGKDDQPDHILWITGEVDSDLKIHPVEHVPEKLQQSAVLFEEIARQQQPLTLIVPAANRESVSDDRLPRGVKILAIDSAAELFQTLRLKTSSNGAQSSSVPAAAENSVSEAASASRAKSTLMVAGGLAATVAIAVAGFTFHESGQNEARQVNATVVESASVVADNETPTLTLYELRAPQGSNCKALRFYEIEPEQNELNPAPSGNYHSAHSDKLCGLIFKLASSGKNARLKLETRFIKGDWDFKNSKLFALMPQIQQGPVANWKVIFPRRIREGFQYEIMAGANSNEPDHILHFGD